MCMGSAASPVKSAYTTVGAEFAYGDDDVR